MQRQVRGDMFMPQKQFLRLREDVYLFDDIIINPQQKIPKTSVF